MTTKDQHHIKSGYRIVYVPMPRPKKGESRKYLYPKVRFLRAAGFSYRQLSKYFGVDKTTIWRAITIGGDEMEEVDIIKAEAKVGKPKGWKKEKSQCSREPDGKGRT